MPTLDTITIINPKKGSNNPTIVINSADFDPAIHEVFDPEKILNQEEKAREVIKKKRAAKRKPAPAPTPPDNGDTEI
jgi:hypothetical protein